MLSNSGLFIDDDLPELYSCLIPNSSGFTSASLHMVPPYRDLVSERLCGFERASAFRRVSRSRTLLNFASPSLLSKSIVADAKNDIGLLINYSVAKPAQHSFSFLLLLSISFRLFFTRSRPSTTLFAGATSTLRNRVSVLNSIGLLSKS